MRSPFTTRMSSRGQVGIPGPVRKALAIEPETPSLVIARKDNVVLHRLQEPPWQFLDDMVKQGRHHDADMQGFTKLLRKLRYGR